ncbi:hypothetical protein M514_00567 [Trichuris suis]|uniref:Uncharacterized protein n=1 Tax=Trichuris suis TaxID=68888 RepID=A0A085MM95_9BILA|nr:hypothetical protein M513_00567 [Trichuris suis]KFD60170.1 hypothetical protein M514_00567 [Trichuris suis]
MKTNFRSHPKAKHQNNNFSEALGSFHEPSSAQASVGHQPSQASGKSSYAGQPTWHLSGRKFDPSRLPAHGWIGFGATTLEAVLGGGATYNEIKSHIQLSQVKVEQVKFTTSAG